ncbi:MAG: aldo/keto reductase [Anaerolineae bacterium]|jgi:aryl-alcohol dehydrogenase-like predicted oxidoreductase|nr:aldo/keto reductase [Chloroflexota bacterium]
METRPFGRTGEMMPILSLGCQRLVDEEGCSEAQAIEILHTALERGIRYFDTAWVYSAGQSESRLGMVARERRDEMWIATKLFDPTAEGAKRQLETSLKRLQTDHLDEWRMHDVHSFERLDAMTGPGGALETMLAAREQGIVRNISMSGHTNPQVQIEALKRYPFDTMLVAVSLLDHFVYSHAEEFLPVAAEHQLGVVGMKVFAYNRLTEVAGDALRYSMGLPLTTVIVGCSTMEQLLFDLDVAEHFEPLRTPERQALLQSVMHMVSPENMPWKSVGWQGKEWSPR